MRCRDQLAGALFVVLAVSAAPAAPAAAQSAEEFYKGRTVTWVVGAGAGGTYGIYARIMARGLAKHIPGNPTVVVQHDGAGGGRKAAAFVSNAAPKDGTVIGMTQQNVPIFHILKAKGINFDASRWQWIGNMATFGSVLAVWHTAPAKTLDAMKKTEIVVGATGTSSETFMNPTMAEKFLGLKFKIVTGYRGSRPLFKALEQGEIHGFALSYNSFTVNHADWIRDRLIVFPMQTGFAPEADLKGVPVMWQLGRTEMDRQAMRLVASAERFGRSLFAPGGVPADRVAALRAAFDAAMKDEAVVGEFSKRNLPLDPQPGSEVEKVFGELGAVAPDVIAHAKNTLGL
jgi:tripartite-type tricarboxylate transporter receptor subunit TctC